MTVYTMTERLKRRMPTGQCDNWRGSHARCPSPADGWLLAPDGKPVPGAGYCVYCAKLIVAEYDEKLGEAWRFVERRP